jgi:hypothetical protein
MKILRFLIKHIIDIPNIPFIVITSVILVINYTRNTTPEERMLNGVDFFREEIKENIEKIYPSHFRYFIAIMFWTILLILTFLN